LPLVCYLFNCLFNILDSLFNNLNLLKKEKIMSVKKIFALINELCRVIFQKIQKICGVFLKNRVKIGGGGAVWVHFSRTLGCDCNHRRIDCVVASRSSNGA
jgi:hypothetical protein